MMYAQSNTSNTSLARPFLVLLLSLMAVVRLDIAASWFCGRWHEQAVFDVRVFNPHTSYSNQPHSTYYRTHENVKKRTYEQRIREIEHGTFTPLVLSLTRGMEAAATVCYNRLASMIVQKRDKAYSRTML